MSDPELACRAANTVGEAAGGRVLVLGSLPPGGRDLDLLVRAPERERLERALTAAGYARKGSTFALFEACTAYGIELIRAEDYLPAAACTDLFEAARPLEGLRHLLRPAPAHALVILARLAWDEGGVTDKRRTRLARIEAEDPMVWERARPIAAQWGEARKLDFLRHQGGHGHRRLVRAARPRRGRLVALSGIDGAGKSSQARWLAQALTALGAPAEVVWNDLLGNVALDVVAKPIKAVRQSWRGEVTPMSSYADREPPADAGTSRVRALWSSYVTLSNSLEQRIRALPARARGRVVVFDRGPLDLAVRMEVLYRSRVERQRRLVALAAPRPDLAFLLDLDPGLSLGRKQDIWSPRQLREQAATYRALAPRFGARVLDASRPPELLAAEIARAVWLSG